MKVHVTKAQFENFLEGQEGTLSFVINKTENSVTYFYMSGDEVIAWCEKKFGNRRRDYVISMPIQDYTSISG